MGVKGFRQGRGRLCGVPRLSVGLVKQLAKNLKRRSSFSHGCVSSPLIGRLPLFREATTSGIVSI